jgi:pSer/pThr/pTyr-binding forkhead associated (FHA) protein
MFRGMATLLYIITEGIQGGPFELTEGTHILGSAEGSTILISDTTISAQHGQFTITDGQIVYQDLGSQNGSFVEQQPVTSVTLVAGHIVQVGNIHVQLVDDPSVVETMKRETAVIQTGPKAIQPGDFDTSDKIKSPFQVKKSGWVKVYIIVITIIGVLAVGALILLLFFPEMLTSSN